MKCALVWLPFNDPSMPPLGIANMVGYLRGRNYKVDPFDINVELYAKIKTFFKAVPEKLLTVHRGWCFDQAYQSTAAALAFPEIIPEPGPLQRIELPIFHLLKKCLYDFANEITDQYGIVGISVTNVSVLPAIALSRIIKKTSPDTQIIWGGPTVNDKNSRRELERLDDVDLFIQGPGEKIIEAILEKSLDENKLIHNKWYDQDDSQYGFESNPDFSFFQLKKYDNLSLPVQTTLGCPWGKCSFCVEPAIKREFVARPVQDVKRYLTVLQDKYPGVSLYFVDNCLNANSNRLRDICQVFHRNSSVSWTCMVRTPELSEQLLSEMKAAGCSKIFIGLESLSARILKAMNKGCSPLDHLRAFRLARETNIALEGNFMIGFPTEEPGDIIETIAIIKRYTHLWRHCRFWISPFTVTPGSKIFVNPASYNIEVYKTGNETNMLPDAVSMFVPVWSNHWGVKKQNEEIVLEMCRLNYELESLLDLVQTRDLPKQYFQYENNKIFVFSENESRTELIKIKLTKIQAEIVSSCLDILTKKMVCIKLGIGYDMLDSVLEEMEAKGWVAVLEDKIVTTIPYNTCH